MAGRLVLNASTSTFVHTVSKADCLPGSGATAETLYRFTPPQLHNSTSRTPGTLANYGHCQISTLILIFGQQNIFLLLSTSDEIVLMNPAHWP